MARVWLMKKAQLYPIIHEMSDGTAKKEAVDIYHKAERNLAVARAVTQWEKLPYPMVKNPQASQLTDVGLKKEHVRFGNHYLIVMEGGEDNEAAMAIEMGHAPSGYYEGSATKAPHGLGILTRAAGLTMLNLTPSTRRGR